MQRKFKINVDGRDYDVTVVEVTDGDGGLYPDRGTMHASPVDPTGQATAAAPPSASAAGPSAGPGDVASPLAGIVQAVLVEVGQTVAEDTHVVTLEAMKTKTVVTAGRAGTVTAVLAAPNQAVDAGQPLLTVG